MVLGDVRGSVNLCERGTDTSSPSAARALGPWVACVEVVELHWLTQGWVRDEGAKPAL